MSGHDIIVIGALALEEAFFVVLRTLNEQISLYQRMADRARADQKMPLVNRLDEKVSQLKQHAARIETILAGKEKLSDVSSA